MTRTRFLHRMLQPLEDSLSPEFPRTITELQADSDLQVEVENLRCKANAGTLTVAESEQYHEFIDALDVISVLQSMARKRLQAGSADNSINAAHQTGPS
jgi:hypothetical protein